MHSGWGDAVRSWAYTNDAAGRRVSELGPSSAGNVGTHLSEWAWNADGTINTKTLYAGISAATGVRDRWTYYYDVHDRITQRTRTGTAAAGLNQTYSYDPAGRLTGWAGQTFGYDHNSNRTNANGTAYTYRADNSIRNVGVGPLYTYHDFGGVLDDGPKTYGYDGFGRVLTTTEGAETTTQRHDGLGRTRATFVDGTTPAEEPGDRLLYYIGLSDTLSHELVLDPPPAPILFSARYVTSPAGTLAVYNLVPLPPTVHTLHEDGQGDTVLLDDLNGSTSAVICPVSFDPWGNTPTAAPPCPMGVSANSIWYRGEHRTQGTGTYTFGARTYNPSTATWLSPDTSHSTTAPSDQSIVTDPLTANRYSYVNGDPVNFIDPSGHGSADAAEHKAADAAERGETVSCGTVRTGQGSSTIDCWSASSKLEAVKRRQEGQFAADGFAAPVNEAEAAAIADELTSSPGIFEVNSLGVCGSAVASGWVSVWDVAVEVELCTVWDGDALASIGFAGIGAGALYVGASAGPMLTNADEIDQLLGGTLCIGASGGAGLGGGGEICLGLNEDESLSGIWTIFGGVGVGEGVDVHLVVGETMRIWEIDIPCIDGPDLPKLPLVHWDLPDIGAVGCG